MDGRTLYFGLVQRALFAVLAALLRMLRISVCYSGSRMLYLLPYCALRTQTPDDVNDGWLCLAEPVP